MTRQDAADRLEVHVRTVDRLIKDGYLRATKFRNAIYIDDESVNEYEAMIPKRPAAAV